MEEDFRKGPAVEVGVGPQDAFKELLRGLAVEVELTVLVGIPGTVLAQEHYTVAGVEEHLGCAAGGLRSLVRPAGRKAMPM